MKKTALQIQATREAGMVDRCHVPQIHGSYNIAQHSFGAVSLLLLLHPCPSRDLIKAVMWHDVAERWLGDLPSPAKAAFPELKRVYEEAERTVLASLNLLPGLRPDEQSWLRGVDALELWMWSREQIALGNTTTISLRDNIQKVLHAMKADGDLPQRIWEFYMDRAGRPLNRLSDYFTRVVTDGLGEAED